MAADGDRPGDGAPLSDDRRAQLRTIAAEGACSSAMVGLGETYLPAFALAIGGGAVVASLVATVPMMMGSVLQTVTPRGVRLVGSYRRWVVTCALLQALCFAPLVVGAFEGGLTLAWLFVAAAGYWTFGMAVSPAWNAWITELVPRAVRPRYFARRSRLAQGALLAALLVAATTLQAGRERGTPTLAFAALFLAAGLARLGSAGLLALHQEPPGLVARHRGLTSERPFAAIRERGVGRQLAYLIGVQLAVNVAGPFFTPFMIGPLQLSYTEWVALTAAALVTRMLVLPWFGRWAHARGTGPLLWFGAVAVVPIPALWLVDQHLGYLLVLQVLSGAAWAALELAMVLVFFDGIPAHDRTRVLSAYNLANSFAIGAGAIAGCQLFAATGGGLDGYWWLFIVSTAGRLLMLLVLKTPAALRRPGFVVLRTLAVRPSTGVIERPVVATLDAPDEEGDLAVEPLETDR